MTEPDEVVKAFLVESLDGLDQLDRDLIVLEENPGLPELVSGIFRVLHTIKGTSSLLGFGRVESISHVAENLLSAVRDGHLPIDAQITSVLLKACDALREQLTSIDSTGGEAEADYSKLVQELVSLATGTPGPTSPAPETQAADRQQGDTKGLGVDKPQARQAPAANAQASQSGGPTAATGRGMGSSPVPVEPSNDLLGTLLVQRGLVRKEHLAEALAAQRAGDVRPLGEILVAKGHAKASDIADALQAQAESRGTVSESTIRVDVALLDKLMNLVGELVLTRNQILQHTTASGENSAFAATTQRLNLITTELQEGVMKTRMQPIGNIWSQFPRVVRDLAVSCGKRVRIEMEGKETELDKTIIEAIKAPLTHIVRNAVDHGIEPPEVRVALGKPTEARLFLRAFHEGGQVNIEISDDGAGVDPERIKAKALARGQISAEQAARMTERELINLVFLPGFSTAEQVTNISGRGVGMDVVKTNIEKIGGTVDLQSRVGVGTTLKIKIPLTLAIIPALTVTCASDRYAIAQVNLVELVRLDGDQARKGIEMIAGAPVYRLRGNLLPLVYLNQTLRLGEPSQRASDESINIVVLQAGERTFGLVVDEVNDTEEIVVKPLSKQLKGIPVYAGATIMGDGKVALILDVLGLAQHAQVVSEAKEMAAADKNAAEHAGLSDTQTLLLFRVGDSGRMAVPLSSVARLEELPRSAIEQSAGMDVVQYRGRIMPLIHLSKYLTNMQALAQEPSSTVHVVVYADQQRSVGLIVDQILDIVEDSVALQKRHSKGWVLGTAVIQQHVTDLLDVSAVIESAGVDLLQQTSRLQARV